MSERWGTCHVCRGQGTQVVERRSMIPPFEFKTFTVECASCMLAPGFSGDAMEKHDREWFEDQQAMENNDPYESQPMFI